MGKKNIFSSDISDLKFPRNANDLKDPQVPQVLKGLADPPCFFEKNFTIFCKI